MSLAEMKASRFFGYPETDLDDRLFYIHYMAVEGDDGTNSKLVIRHSHTRTGATEIVVPLCGRWEEMEKPDLEMRIAANFLPFSMGYMEEHKKTLEQKKKSS